MGLVRITASSCQLRPSHIAALVERPQRTLKASNPAPLFRRKTNILTEDRVQPPLADAQRACRFANAKRPKQVQRPANMASPFPCRSSLTEHLVQDLQRNLGRGFQIAQAITHRFHRPQVVKTLGLFVEEGRAFTQPRAKSSG